MTNMIQYDDDDDDDGSWTFPHGLGTPYECRPYHPLVSTGIETLFFVTVVSRFVVSLDSCYTAILVSITCTENSCPKFC